MHQNRGINRTFVPIIVRVGLTLPVFPSVYYQHRIIRRTTPGQNRYAMTFQELNLIEPLKRAVAEKGYTTPTPIQQQAIPPALEGRDLLGCAQTGTGKTAAFTLPILQLLSAEPRTKGRRTIKTLVLTPTRELAIQIDECCRDYARYTDIRHCVIFGGVNQRPQVDALQRGIDLLVATPGRLLDLIGQGYVSLSDIRFFVLDEADRMLDMGFIHDIRRILPLLPAKRQTLFFSATMPDDIVKLANTMLRNPAHVTVTPPASVVETIRQSVLFAEKAEKRTLLASLLRERPESSVLVFSRTKHGADRIARILTKAGIEGRAIHGDKSQGARERAMNDFRSGACRVLIATDIAARGIDISELPLVINYDLPEVPETYVHRIGRTGRAGRDGQAIAFCSEEERPLLKDILKLTGLELDPDSGELAPAQNSRKKPAGKKPDTAQTGGQKQAEGRSKRRKSEPHKNSPHKVRPDRGRAGASRRDRLPAIRNRKGNEPAASRPRTGNSRRTRTPRHARHAAATVTGAGKNRTGKTQRPQTRNGDRMTENPEVRNPPGTNGKREAPRHPEKRRRRRRKSPAWAAGCPASSGRAANNHRATCPPATPPSGNAGASLRHFTFLHIAAHHLVPASHSKTATPQTRTGVSRRYGNRTAEQGNPARLRKALKIATFRLRQVILIGFRR